MKVKSLSRVRLLATPWTAAHKAPPSMGFSRQEYWSGVPLPSPKEGQRTQKRKVSAELGLEAGGGKKSEQFIAVVTNYLSESSLLNHSSLLG